MTTITSKMLALAACAALAGSTMYAAAADAPKDSAASASSQEVPATPSEGGNAPKRSDTQPLTQYQSPRALAAIAAAAAAAATQAAAPQNPEPVVVPATPSSDATSAPQPPAAPRLDGKDDPVPASSPLPKSTAAKDADEDQAESGDDSEYPLTQRSPKKEKPADEEDGSGSEEIDILTKETQPTDPTEAAKPADALAVPPADSSAKASEPAAAPDAKPAPAMTGASAAASSSGQTVSATAQHIVACINALDPKSMKMTRFHKVPTKEYTQFAKDHGNETAPSRNIFDATYTAAHAVYTAITATPNLIADFQHLQALFATVEAAETFTTALSNANFTSAGTAAFQLIKPLWTLLTDHKTKLADWAAILSALSSKLFPATKSATSSSSATAAATE